MRAAGPWLATIPAMIGECLHDPVSDRECIPPRGAGNLDFFSSTDGHCQISMFVPDGIALRYR